MGCAEVLAFLLVFLVIWWYISPEFVVESHHEKALVWSSRGILVICSPVVEKTCSKRGCFAIFCANLKII